MDFFIGNQFSAITPDGDLDDGEKQYYWQEREVYNHIAPIIETRLAKLHNVKPNVNVRPATNADKDISAAKFASRLIEAAFLNIGIEAVINEGTMWAELCGTCFYKLGWNARAGALAGKRADGSLVYEGAAEITVCPPFEIYPDDVNAAGISGAGSLIHAKIYTIDEIREIWGVDVEPEPVNAFSADNTPTEGTGYSPGIRKIIFEKKENCAYVIERHEMPTKAFPGGRLTIVAGNKLVCDTQLPYPKIFEESHFPFVRQTSIEQAGCFFGTSVIERLIPVQRAYNAVRNRKHEFLNRMSVGILAVEDGSVDTDNLEEEGLAPGKVLVYRQGSAPPHMLDVGKLPDDFHSEEEKLLEEFVMISGVSEISKYSNVPRTVTSGIAMSLLIEQDETRLNITARSILGAVKNIGAGIVGLYKLFAVKSRLARIAKDAGERVFEEFLKGGITRNEIIVESDNDVLNTPASRRSMVIDLLKLGLFADENGKLSDRMRVKALEALGLGNWESARDVDELHIKKAIKENEEMRERDMEIDGVDDHKLHIAEHIKAIIDGTITDAAHKERLTRHTQEHKKLCENKV
jgi:hypothetical protein